MEEYWKLKSSWKINFVESEDGTRLRYALLLPQIKEIKACLIIINGRNECLEKYDYLAEDLNLADDCGVLCWDHRGQGASSGQSSHVDSYDDFVNDAELIISKALGAKIPYMILAHSMGALISLSGAMSSKLKPGSLCLNAPFLGVPNDPLPSFLVKLIAKTVSSLGGKNVYISWRGNQKIELFSNNKRTNSIERFERIVKSPYKGKNVTFGWLNASFAALKKVFNKEQIKKLKMPIKVFLPEDESIVNGEDIEKWFNKAKTILPDLTLVKIPNGKHELLSEADICYKPTLAHIQKSFNAWYQQLK